MTRIEWTEPAVSDLDNIHDYIARDSAEYADVFVERLVLAAERLHSFPSSGRVVPEAKDQRVREVLVESYRIIYRVKLTKVQILTVVHGARDLTRMTPKPWAQR
ncbi:MAG: type II toxin-antitoxin system RelE/ParE family toxin [Nitrospira sp.]|nr:type II toxin-antitoxin system RelE/ParE family toxin [Nitrospira sp.]